MCPPGSGEPLAALLTHLLASVDGAPAALRGTEAEAAGAAFGVGSVQGEGSQAALVTSGALNVLLGRRPGQGGWPAMSWPSAASAHCEPLANGPLSQKLLGSPPCPCSLLSLTLQ